MKSLDAVEGNVAKIAALFPHCVTETAEKITESDGKVRYESRLVVDFDKLREELSTDALDSGEERYQFTWPDKRAASRLANTPTDKTLRPDVNDSVDFWNTKNLYIEGDNLDVLKVLRENYLGKIKMIYIDPPYNTGNDFVYNDDFTLGKDDFEANSGLFNEDGNQVLDPMQRNTESNGRFHTDWLNMIYPRLKVARDLLADDGAIYISMDDNEIMNLEKICAEVFGEQNFVACIVWQKKYAATNDSKGYSTTHDYILVYSKNLDLFDRNLLPRTEEQNAPYKNDDGDGKGLWRSDNILVKSFSPSGVYPIINPNTGVEYLPPEGSCWRASQETMKRWLAENRIYFGKDGKGAPQLKRYLNEVQQGRVPLTWWSFDEVGHNDAANKEISALFGRKTPFDTPKPTTLIGQMLRISSHSDSIILDFFSGSATTAHAVMKLNAEDGGRRKFIMVQLPEVPDEKSEARKAGYETICQIGEERIRRAGKSIIAELRNKISQNERSIARLHEARPNTSVSALLMENKKEATRKSHEEKIKFLELENIEITKKISHLDTGFRVLKLDSSNMEDVFYTPEDFNEADLFNYVDNVKPDRTPLDLLFQVMPELDIELSAKIEEKEVNGKNVFFVDGTYLIATFDTEVNESTVTEIAKMKPQYFVMRDASAANDNVLDNFEQIFKHYSPDTIRRIL